MLMMLRALQGHPFVYIYRVSMLQMCNYHVLSCHHIILVIGIIQLSSLDYFHSPVNTIQVAQHLLQVKSY